MGQIKDETLVVRNLGQIERMLVCTPALANSALSSPRQLETLPLLSLQPFEGQKIPLHNTNGETFAWQKQPIMATNNIFALKQAALMSLGVAILPKWFVEQELQNGELLDTLPQWRAPTLDLNIAYLPAKRQPRRLRSFIDAMSEGLGSIPGIQNRQK